MGVCQRLFAILLSYQLAAQVIVARVQSDAIGSPAPAASRSSVPG